jgi:hypothetical protein
MTGCNLDSVHSQTEVLVDHTLEVVENSLDLDYNLLDLVVVQIL